MVTSSCLILLAILLSTIPQVLSLGLISFILPDVLDALRANRKMDEFIKHLGIPNVDLCYPSKDINLVPMFNEDLPFGDLILDEGTEGDADSEDTYHDASSSKSSRSGSKSKGKKSKSKKKKWKDGVIPYYISRDYTSRQKETIENSIEEMNSKLTNVRFRRFRYFDRNYVLIFSGKGCYAKLGMVGGQQPVCLQADKCLRNGIIQHELMHAVGFSHEQNRPDRDDYIKLLMRNIPGCWLNEYQRNNPAEAAFVGEYDYYSVMHYPAVAPKNKDKLAFKVLDEDVDESDIGNKDELSDMDVQKIDEYYS